MEPVNKNDKLVEERASDNGRVNKWTFETPSGKFYSICQNSDGEEWVVEE